MINRQGKSDKDNIFKKVTVGIFILLGIITLTNILIQYYIWREHSYQNLLKLEEHHYFIKSMKSLF